MIAVYVFLVDGLRIDGSSQRQPPAYTVQVENETGTCFKQEESVKNDCPA